MFSNIGPAELLTLALVGMFVLGPERLPQAAAWIARTVRTVKDYAAGARDQLQGELGTNLDDLRKPLDDLRSIRDLDPRRAVRQHLFDDGPVARSVVTAGSAGASSAPAVSAAALAPIDDEAT